MRISIIICLNATVLFQIFGFYFMTHEKGALNLKTPHNCLTTINFIILEQCVACFKKNNLMNNLIREIRCLDIFDS